MQVHLGARRQDFGRGNDTVRLEPFIELKHLNSTAQRTLVPRAPPGMGLPCVLRNVRQARATYSCGGAASKAGRRGRVQTGAETNRSRSAARADALSGTPPFPGVRAYKGLRVHACMHARAVRGEASLLFDSCPHAKHISCHEDAPPEGNQGSEDMFWIRNQFDETLSVVRCPLSKSKSES